MKAHHDHPCHPEKQDVVSGDQQGRRIVLVEVGGLCGPAQRGERQQRRAEPSVKNVGILFQVGRRERWALRRRSEEHTSELKSRGNLECRLLLEKKKENNV